MSAEVVAKILSISIDEESGGYIVEFWVGQELTEAPTLNQAFALLGSMDSLQRETFSFVVQWEDGEFTMEPDEALAECLALFDQNETPEGLESPLDRIWKTGQMAEALVTHLVHANIFGVWRTYDQDEEDEHAVEPDADVDVENESTGDDDQDSETAPTEVLEAPKESGV